MLKRILTGTVLIAGAVYLMNKPSNVDLAPGFQTVELDGRIHVEEKQVFDRDCYKKDHQAFLRNKNANHKGYLRSDFDKSVITITVEPDSLFSDPFIIIKSSDREIIICEDDPGNKEVLKFYSFAYGDQYHIPSGNYELWISDKGTNESVEYTMRIEEEEL